MSVPLRVATDLRPLSPPFTGVSNYTLYLFEALLRQSGEEELSLIGVGAGGVERIDLAYIAAQARAAGKDTLESAGRQAAPERGSLAGRVKGAVLPWLRAVPGLRELRNRLASAHYGAGLAQAADLFHATVYVPMHGVDLPTIPVIYDMSPLRHPEFHPAARLRQLDTLAEVAARAPVVHTISAFTAAEIAALLPVDPARIVTIRPGLSPVFAARGQAPADPAALAAHGLAAGRYGLMVSTLEPRKNMRTVVEAYARLPAATRSGAPLVVVGAKGWGDLKLPAGAEALTREGSLRFLGYVPDGRLRDLYAGASVFCYPSLYEGYGLPIIEALACGAPVLAADAASMPEALGAEGRLIAPLDVEGWTLALEEALALGRGTHAEQAARRTHARAHDWEEAAKACLAMYKRV